MYIFYLALVESNAFRSLASALMKMNQSILIAMMRAKRKRVTRAPSKKKTMKRLLRANLPTRRLLRTKMHLLALARLSTMSATATWS